MRWMTGAGVVLLSFAASVYGGSLENPASLNETAPEAFKVKFETTKGDVVFEVTRAWAPKGADRFYNLVKNGYFEGVKFFRVVPNFVVQFGLHGDQSVAKKWSRATIDDDPVKESNKRGYLTYAKTNAPNSRSVQLFVNLRDNTRLDGMGFAPIGRVVEGMDVVDSFHSGYGEEPSSFQGRIIAEGNAFLEKSYPELDAIEKATLQ